MLSFSFGVVFLFFFVGGANPFLVGFRVKPGSPSTDIAILFGAALPLLPSSVALNGSARSKGFLNLPQTPSGACHFGRGGTPFEIQVAKQGDGLSLRVWAWRVWAPHNP